MSEPQPLTGNELACIAAELRVVRPEGYKVWRDLQIARQADNAVKQSRARAQLTELQRRAVVRAELIRQLDELIAAQTEHRPKPVRGRSATGVTCSVCGRMLVESEAAVGLLEYVHADA